MTVQSSPRPRPASPVEAAGVAAGKCRDDLVDAALLLAGRVKSTAVAEEIADELVTVVIAATSYVQAREDLAAAIADEN
jgi:hypothetical protein